MLPSSTARDRIGGTESKRLSLALEERVFSSKARSPCFPYNPRVRERLEYAAAWLLLKTIGAMPRPLARFAGARMAAFLLWARPGLRRAAMEHLSLGIPGLEQEAAPDGRTRHGAAARLDGRGVRPFSALHEREYRAPRAARRI